MNQLHRTAPTQMHRRRLEWHVADRWARQTVDEEDQAEVTSMRVTGDVLLDMPGVSPIWGGAAAPFSAEGQPWMVVGSDGTGKTSTAGQYAHARLGLTGAMWDEPVEPLSSELSVYYFAADRPRQGMEAFKRSFGEKDRPLLRERLHIHKGPPPFRLSSPRGQQWLLREVEETNAGLVILDSRKDFGSTTNADEVAGVVTAVQLLVASDIEVLLLHHPNEASLRRNGPPELADISGHGAVYSGMGSVLFLKGRAGSTLIDVHHLKPIRGVVPPFKIQHDHAAGVSERLAVGIVPGSEKGELTEGRMALDRFEVRVLRAIDDYPSEWCPASVLKEALDTDNLSRDLKGLIEHKVIEHNGARAAQSAYRRGPNAPPPK